MTLLVPTTSVSVNTPTLFHIHGGDAVRKLVAPLALDLIVLTVDCGDRSGAYERAFRDPDAFGRLLANAESEKSAARTEGEGTRDVVVTSWSAGYGALDSILTQASPRVRAYVLLDSLHAGFTTDERKLVTGQLAPFVRAAKSARSGGPKFFVTHTAIQTPDYASTTATAAFLLSEIGVADRSGAYRDGGLFVRGYEGATPEAHCDQLRLLPGLLPAALH